MMRRFSRRLTLIITLVTLVLGMSQTSAVLAAPNLDLNSIYHTNQFYVAGDDDPCDVAGGDTGGNLTGADNVMKAMNFYVSKGLKPAAAAGLIGNFMVESGSERLDPAAQQNGSSSKLPIDGVGFGLAQWTNSSRQKPLVALAAQEQKTLVDQVTDATDLKLQLDYSWQELSANPTTKPPALDYASVLKELRALDVTDEVAAAVKAADEVELDYEGPKDPASSRARREDDAKQALAAFRGNGGTDPTTTPGGPDTCAPGVSPGTGNASAAACATGTGNIKILDCALTFDPYLYDWGGGHGGARLFMQWFNAGVADGSIKQGVTPVLDCSGLVGVATYMAFGVDDVHGSNDYDSSKNWKTIDIKSAKPGDIVSFQHGGDGHVAIVVSNGGNGELDVFAARTANDSPSRQIDYTRHTSYSFWNTGALHYVGPGGTP